MDHGIFCSYKLLFLKHADLYWLCPDVRGAWWIWTWKSHMCKTLFKLKQNHKSLDYSSERKFKKKDEYLFRSLGPVVPDRKHWKSMKVHSRRKDVWWVSNLSQVAPLCSKEALHEVISTTTRQLTTQRDTEL